MKKTNVISGACFGYFDPEFDECNECGISASCINAARSDKIEEIRAIAKINIPQVDELVRQWNPDAPVLSEDPVSKEQRLSLKENDSEDSLDE